MRNITFTAIVVLAMTASASSVVPAQKINSHGEKEIPPKIERQYVVKKSTSISRTADSYPINAFKSYPAPSEWVELSVAGDQKTLWQNESFMLDAGFEREGRLQGYICSNDMGQVSKEWAVYDKTNGSRLEGGKLTGDTQSDFVLYCAYNPYEDMVYAVTYDDEGSGYLFRSINPDTQKFTTIGTYPSSPLAMTFNLADRKVYALWSDGSLYRTDPVTAATEMVGNTGLQFANYKGSMTYLPSSGNLMALVEMNQGLGTVNLLEINPNTGSVTSTAEVAGGQYLVMISTEGYAPEGAPAQCEVKDILFPEGALSGNAIVKLPSVMAAGGAIEATDIWLEVKVDGTMLENSKYSPGAETNVSLGPLEEGMHEFSFVAYIDTNDGRKESLPMKKRMFIGHDTPVAPCDVKLRHDRISWNQPAVGINGGYVDMSGLTFDIYIDGEKVNAVPAKGTNYAIDLPMGELRPYEGSVMAVSGSKKSSMSVADRYVYGEPMSLPMSIAPNDEEFNICTVVDANNDGNTWQYAADGGAIGYFIGQTNADDWIFLPPFKVADVSKVCRVAMNARASFDFWPESFEIAVGDDPSPEAMKTISRQDNIGNSEFKEFSADFIAPDSDVFYVGVHVVSGMSSYQLVMCDFKVEQTTKSIKGPGDISELNLIPAENGVPSLTVSFRLPEKDVTGNSIEKSRNLSAKIKAGETESVLLGKPGELVQTIMSVIDGSTTVSVTCFDGEDEGSTVSGIVYVGKDMPAEVKNLSGKVDEDNFGVVLSWEAPDSKGVNGGYVDTGDLTYYLCEFDPEKGWYITEELGKKIYSFHYRLPDGAPLKRYNPAIVAGNAVGIPMASVKYFSIMAGTPYNTPLEEDFSGGTVTNNPLEYTGSWILSNPSMLYSDVKSENDMSLIGMAYSAAVSTLSIPEFTTEGMKSPTVALRIFFGRSNARIRVVAESYDTDSQILLDESLKDRQEGWQDVVVELPSVFNDRKWVSVKLEADYPEAYNYVVLDSYKVYDDVASDLAMRSVTGFEKIGVGNMAQYKINVVNTGTMQAELPRVKAVVRKNDSIVDSFELETDVKELLPAGAVEYIGSFIPGVDHIGELQLEFSFVDYSDLNGENDNIKLIARCSSDAVYAVSDLQGTNESDVNRLFWSCPENIDTNEGFENEVSFFYNGMLGLMENKDADGKRVYGFTWSFDGMKEAKGFQIFDNSGFEYANFKAFDGNKFALAMCPSDGTQADDWLISPLIAPGSEISFALDIVSEEYGNETVEILYSVSGSAPEDFIKLKTVEKNKKGWERISATLPMDARYFAIRYISKDILGIFIDDINFISLDRASALNHYDIYRDGVKIGSSTNLSYEDNAPVGEHAYNVVPVTELNGIYTSHQMSNTVLLGGSSYVGNTLETTISVEVESNGVCIKGAEGSPMTINRLDGINIYNGKVSEDIFRFALDKGVYIIKIAGKVYKIVI